MENQMRKAVIKKSKSLFIIYILIVIVILYLGCQSPTQPKECIEFFNTDSTQRLKEFSKYDLEKQLTIHQCGLDWRPPYDRSYEIAKRGKSIIPILLQKLNTDNNKNRYETEKTKYGVILIFQRLAENGDLDNREVIKILEQIVSEFKTDWIKEEAKESLVEIKKSVKV